MRPGALSNNTDSGNSPVGVPPKPWHHLFGHRKGKPASGLWPVLTSTPANLLQWSLPLQRSGWLKLAEGSWVPKVETAGWSSEYVSARTLQLIIQSLRGLQNTYFPLTRENIISYREIPLVRLLLVWPGGKELKPTSDFFMSSHLPPCYTFPLL